MDMDFGRFQECCQILRDSETGQENHFWLDLLSGINQNDLKSILFDACINAGLKKLGYPNFKNWATAKKITNQQPLAGIKKKFIETGEFPISTTALHYRDLYRAGFDALSHNKTNTNDGGKDATTV